MSCSSAGFPPQGAECSRHPLQVPRLPRSQLSPSLWASTGAWHRQVEGDMIPNPSSILTWIFQTRRHPASAEQSNLGAVCLSRVGSTKPCCFQRTSVQHAEGGTMDMEDNTPFKGCRYSTDEQNQAMGFEPDQAVCQAQLAGTNTDLGCNINVQRKQT